MAARFHHQTLYEKAAEFIARHRLLAAGDRLGVAVSGGADSTALLRLLLEMRAELGVVLSVVHFNHRIRGADADEDERFVRSLAERYALEFHAGAGDVPAHARLHGLSLETAARELRYAYFRQLLTSGVEDKIATAHTRDDQAETVLLRLLRGAGTKGLAGIYPELHLQDSRKLDENISSSCATGESCGNPGPQTAIVRPLLEIGRSQIEDYLRSLGQSWREDRSNQDVHHARNRLRHVLLPLIEREFNPAIRSLLGETAEIARAEEEFWARVAADAFASVKPHGWPGVFQSQPDRVDSGHCASPGRELHIGVSELIALPLALQRRVVRAAAEEVGVALTFEHVEGIIRLAGGTSGKQVELPAVAVNRAEKPSADSSATASESWCVRRVATCPRAVARPGEAVPSRPELVFALAAKESQAYCYVLPVPGEVRVPELGVRFTAAIVSPVGCDRIYNRWELADPDRFGAQVLVRNWQRGDRFRPPHSKTERKVKELLQLRRISGRERSLWPVMVSASGELLWMRGVGMAMPALAAPQAGMVLAIGEEPLAGEELLNEKQ